MEARDRSDHRKKRKYGFGERNEIPFDVLGSRNMKEGERKQEILERWPLKEGTNGKMAEFGRLL